MECSLSLSLSLAGKKILIKFVAQAIPLYYMGVFILPASLCEEIERIMNSFYWGSNKSSRRGINRKWWDKLTLHKSLWGLCFRNMEAFNLSMLGNQSWKLLTDSSSLLTHVLTHQCLPTRVNLSNRGIPCNKSCVSCKLLAESHMHIFFVCSKAFKCWDRIGIDNIIWD